MLYDRRSLIAAWNHHGIRLELHRSPRPRDRDSVGVWVGYQVLDHPWASATGTDALIFAGDDLGTIGPCIDSLRTIEVLCRFLSLLLQDLPPRSGAAVRTPTQLAWLRAHGDDLDLWGHEGIGPQLGVLTGDAHPCPAS